MVGLNRSRYQEILNDTLRCIVEYRAKKDGGPGWLRRADGNV